VKYPPTYLFTSNQLTSSRDAVILDSNLSSTSFRGILAEHKTPTSSPNVTDGIEAAVRAILEKSEVDKNRIACLTIGTTHFVNAIIEHDCRRLSKVAIIRLSKSFTKEIPPLFRFPTRAKGHYEWILLLCLRRKVFSYPFICQNLIIS
jgi:hypothetical protein